ncbi:LOW QUALITY PROTEIN: chromodomain-helicase-DNA-binding protein 1-like [Guaruba guarouba]
MPALQEGIKLHPYQISVNWLVQCYEMISLLLYLAKIINEQGEISDTLLSVLSNWKEELETTELQQTLGSSDVVVEVFVLLLCSTFGHRVLLFSQMTQLLDTLQAHTDYRGYSYEWLDGSGREERHLTINKFRQQPIFIFLLNTRAGGVGMNLRAAHTVIFTDGDFNPQNDLQGIARAHQIEQHK